MKYFLASAQIALTKSGYHEVIIHAHKGLTLIKHLKMSPGVNDTELSFQLLLGISFSNTKGFAAIEAKEAFSKARELSRLIDNDQLLFRTHFGLWLFFIPFHADLPLARDFGREMVKVARRSRNPEFLMIASMSVGITDFYLGYFARACHSLEKVRTSNNAKDSEAAAMICGWNPLIGATAYKAHSLWFLGYPGRAFAAIEKALALARENATPYDCALTYSLVATYFAYSGDPQRSMQFCDSTLEIANEGGFYHWTALTTILKGSACCKLGQIGSGMKLINEGISQWKATGADKAKPVFYAFEAEACLIAKNKVPAWPSNKALR